MSRSTKIKKGGAAGRWNGEGFVYVIKQKKDGRRTYKVGRSRNPNVEKIGPEKDPSRGGATDWFVISSSSPSSKDIILPHVKPSANTMLRTNRSRFEKVRQH